MARKLADIELYENKDLWIIKEDKIEKKVKKEQNTKEKKEKKKQFFLKYQFVQLIAKQWFNALEKVTDIEDLKEKLSGFTLVGEYIGNLDFQHFVSYTEINIYFYALIKNNGEDTCFPPNVTENFCKKYGLKTVGLFSRETVKDFSSLKIALAENFKRISSKSLQESGEGVVLAIFLFT